MSISNFEQDPGSKKPKKDKKEELSSRTPILDNFSRDLVLLASEGALDPVIGREKEIRRVAQILSRRKKNNPILIGEPGCGKTALIEGLAMKINNGNCPRNLLDKRIFTLDLTSLVAGTKYRGQFEERMKAVLEELRDNPDIIIFIDEIHTVVGTGNSSGSLDAANIFKPALARGEVQCIGATTIDEYREHIEKDGALERRFQKVSVEPTSVKDTITILSNLKERYEDHHKVIFSEQIISLCVNLADRYISDREFPDKAIDILDEVGAKAQVDIEYPKEIELLREKIDKLKKEKVQVVKSQKYEKAAQLRDKEKVFLNDLTECKERWENEMEITRKEITEDDVYEIVSQMTKIPLTKLNKNEIRTLLNIDKNLEKSVIGQSEAIDKISKAIRRNRTGIREGKRPIGSFMFLGSTGIGKTHLAKAIASELFGDASSLIRVDMSEYTEKFTTSRLIGSPPGYVGYNEGGQLTESVRNKPYSVILFDEIEKAHGDVFNLLLQILEDGHLTDGSGRKVNFKNTLIIMTSNVGAKKSQDFSNQLGFTTQSNSGRKEEHKKEIIKKELKNTFKPEFINRIDEIVFFNHLKPKDVKQITKLEINKLIDRLEEMDYKITYESSVVNFISKEGFDETFGARPIRRTIQDKIEDFISEEVLRENIVPGKKYTLKMDSKKENVIIELNR
tara:strand:- start:2679 stop:4712 length:2034 start_codon:yes stop_codon:yes gene_type:complete